MNKKQWVIVGVFGALFLALSYLGWAFLVNPVKVDIEARETELSDAKKKLEEAQAKAAQRDKFQAMAENVRRDLAVVASRVDPTLPVTELYWIFSSLGNRLALPKYTFEEKPRETAKDAALPGMDRIALKVKFESGFHEIGQFLNGIVGLQRLMMMENFRLTSLEKEDGPALNCELDLALYLEQAKAAGAK